MNKAYKVVYSKARQKFVVASELVRACADRPHSSRFVSVSALMAALGAVILSASEPVAAKTYTSTVGTDGTVTITVGDIDGDGQPDVIEIGGGIGLSVVEGTFYDGSSITPSKYYSLKSFGASSDLGAYSNVIGYSAAASGEYSNAIGYSASAAKDKSNAIGYKANASGEYSNAIGQSAAASGPSSNAIGSYAAASGRYSTAIGLRATTTAESSIAIGVSAAASGNYNSIAIGSSAKTSYGYSIAIGSSAKASGITSNAIGDHAEASGYYSNAIGNYASATKNYSDAIGYGANASEEYSNAIGYKAKVSAQNATAIGREAVADEADTVSVGRAAKAATASMSAVKAITRRIVNVAEGTNDSDAATVGQLKAAISGLSAGDANGYLDVNAADDSKDDAALTFSAKAKGAHSLAVGKDAVASGANSVAIGEGSEATDQNTFSVGRAGKAATDTEGEVAAIKRRIVNVADGTKSSDAATVGQLHTVSLKEGEQYLSDTSAKDETSGITSHVLSINAASAIAADSTGLTASAGLATAKAVYDEVRPEAGEGETLKYVGKGKTTGQNLKALDAQVVKNEGAIASLSTLNETGTTAIRKAVSINKTNNGGFATVTQDDATGEYTVSVTATGTVTNDTAGEALVTGKTVKQAIDAMGFASQSDLDNYAQANAGNIAGHASDWASALSAGAKVAATGATGSGLLVTGAAVYDEVRKDDSNADLNGTYVKSSKTTGQNLKDLDKQVKSNADNISTATTNAATALSTAKNAASQAEGASSAAEAANRVAGAANTNANKALAQTQYLSFNTTGADSSAATLATGTHSLAIGVGATASGENSIAIGWGSVASDPDTFSVGSTSKQRRITNVAAGTAATDAATVGQLRTLELSGGTLSFRQQSAQGKNSVVTYKPEPKEFDDETYASLTPSKTADGATAYKLSLKISNSIGDFSNIPEDGCLGDCPQYYDSLATNKGVFFEVRPTANGKYVSTGKTTAENLMALDDQVSKNSGVLEYLSINPTDEKLTVEPSTSAKAIGKHSVALGEEAKAALGGDNAIGYHAQATGSGSTAIGYTAKATEAWAIAIGVEAEASQQMANAIGRGAKAKGGNSNAIGTNATAEGSSSIAIGNEAKVAQDAQSAIALGAGSVADVAKTVSVGSTGNERRIMHVAKGVDATDAATVAQLPSVSLASGQKYLTLTHADGSTDYKLALATSDNVYDSTPGLVTNVAVKNALDALSTSTAAGSNYLSVNATDNPLVDTPSTSAKATGAHALAMGEGATASGENSVAIGAGSQAVDRNTVSVGTSTQSRRIVNVAEGTHATDVATVSQTATLESASQNFLTVTEADKNENGSKRLQLTIKTGDLTDASAEGLITNTAVKNALGAYAKADGSNVASDSAATWAGKIGTGTIAKATAESKAQLVTGDTVYSEVREGVTGTHVNSGNTVAQNLTALDRQVVANAGAISNLNTLNDTGRTAIRKAVSIKGDGFASAAQDSGTGIYTVSVKADGQVVAGDAGKGLVTGNAVQAALDSLDLTSKVDLSDYAKANAENADAAAWVGKIGTGKISGTEAEGKLLVTGEKVYDEVRKDDHGIALNGTYAKSSKTTGQNLKDLDEQVVANAGKIGTNATAIQGLRNMDNLTAAGETKVRDLAKGSVQVKGGTNTTVTTGTDGNAKTYAVNVTTTGAVASGDTGIISGGKLYSEVRPVDGEYVSATKTTGQNLKDLDTQVKANFDAIGGLKNLTNISDAGKGVIRDVARTAVKVEAGDHVEVKLGTDSKAGTYTVSVKADGQVAAGDTGKGLVTGNTVATAIENLKNTTSGSIANIEQSYAKLNGENLGSAFNAVNWAAALSNGAAIAKDGDNSKLLVTGAALYDEVRPVKGADDPELHYVGAGKTTAENLKALDAQVDANATNITKNTAAITKLANLSNITADGKGVIRNQAIGAVTLADGENTTVTSEVTGSGASKVKTYKVNVATDGQVEADNTGIVTGGTVAAALQTLKDNTTGAITNIKQNYAMLDGSNLSGEGSTFKADKWALALSNGATIAKEGAGSNLLITGAVLYGEVRPVKLTRDGEGFHYIATNSNTGTNLAALDSKLFDLSETIKTYNGKISDVESTANAAAADASAAKRDASDAKTTASAALEKATSAEAKAEDAQKKHTTLVDSDHIKVTESTNDAGGKQYSLSIAETADFTAKQTTWKDGEASSTANSSGFFSGGTSAENADAYVSKGVVSAGKDAEKKIVLDGNTGKATFGKTVTIDGETGRISGVAAGDVSEDSTDAVNGAQLYETQQLAAHNAESIQALGSQVNKVDRKINRTGALAAALAALHPQDYDESHPITGAAGVGHYKGKQALAVGMYVRPAENLMFSLGASASGDSDYMLNAGVSYRFGGPSLQKSPVQMAARISEQEVTIRDLAAQNQVQKTLIESQRDTLDAQKAKLETQDAKLEKQASEIEALKAMMAKIQAKLEK